MSALRSRLCLLRGTGLRFYSTPTAAPTPAPTSAPASKSSVPTGARLTGIQYLKGRADPVALPDSEYPAWLWTALEKKGGGKVEEDLGDLYSKSKKARRAAKKRAAALEAEEAANPDKKVPLIEQTLDLPFATTDGHRAAPIRRIVSAVGPLEGKSGGHSTLNIGRQEGAQEKVFDVSTAEAEEVRRELKRDLRRKSRAGIKEANFISQM
ncbi:hypothetical protein EX30DRAFT_393691 [Ascodesmis nigricans]|uniref:Large ribosomal subunit protein mL54 n=1 Tax=Ascodesmis nigricans TaxID=341454 RepID=A0A4S2N4W4_9PEZI|nr:hypothetical protein EX30DRAFT_393691 [Ascodesmis nigricans]